MPNTLTDPEIRAMASGPELRRLTAEAIGYFPVRVDDDGVWLSRQDGTWMSFLVDNWNPDTDPRDAAVVWDWFEKKQRLFLVHFDDCAACPPYRLHFEIGYEDYVAYGQTREELICRAAILLARRLEGATIE